MLTTPWPLQNALGNWHLQFQFLNRKSTPKLVSSCWETSVSHFLLHFLHVSEIPIGEILFSHFGWTMPPEKSPEDQLKGDIKTSLKINTQLSRNGWNRKCVMQAMPFKFLNCFYVLGSEETFLEIRDTFIAMGVWEQKE